MGTRGEGRSCKRWRTVSAAVALVGTPAAVVTTSVFAGGLPVDTLDEVIVVGHRESLLGRPISSTQGVVAEEQLENRPLLRPAEVLEVVPGLIVTQHSGDGKANQYFLRGFNLDHGTDFATTIDGMPVNLPTHAHGQGYTDLNFLIPELLAGVEYRKGPYYAQEGNFSAAGSVHLRLKRDLEENFVAAGAGGNGFSRVLGAVAPEMAGGNLLLAADYQRNDGPWLLEQDLEKWNAMARYSRGTPVEGWDVSLMAYEGDWRATDQVPLRAVQSGAIDRFGFVNPANGGDSSRYSLSGTARGKLGSAAWSGSAYAIGYELDLFSDFTYVLEPQGDQFEQADRRRIYGFDLQFENTVGLFARESTIGLGIQARHDDIDPVGLYRTRDRQRFAVVREDAVRQTSYGAYAHLDTPWTSFLRSTVGLRTDQFEFDVRSNLAANSGSSRAFLASPKLSLVLGPWQQTEIFVNAGRGFHSNDARGTTIRVDPLDGVTPASRVDALVRADGAEIGARTAWIRNLQLAASLWTLHLDSELVFVGDGGSTEAGPATRRSGVELGLYYTPVEWVIIDADLAWSRPRFVNGEAAGSHVPGAIERAASLGIAIDHPAGWFGGARYRYLGPAALIEDNSVRSRSTTLVNVAAGYRFSGHLSAELSLFNVLDERANDITYFYESRLPGEAAPVADIHFHPVEPRTLRAMLRMSF